MILNTERAIRIGISLNSREKGYAASLAEQYTRRQTYDDIAQALAAHGAEVIEIEADANLSGLS